MTNNEFSVLDMAQMYSDNHNINPEDLFKKEAPIKEDIMEDTINEPVEVKSQINRPKKEKKPWSPSAELIAGMDDLNIQPVIYGKDEIKVESLDKSLKDISDDKALDAAVEAMDDMERKLYNINLAKKRHGIKHFQIPEGPHQTQIYTIASDPNTKAAQEGLDKIFQEIIDLYPMFIKEWEDPSKQMNRTKAPENQLIDIPEDIIPIEDDTTTPNTPIEHSPLHSDVKVVINKTQAPEISWSKEEMEKLKNSRTFELNIVEEVNLPYSQIEDADDNAVDIVLAQYTRKANDVVAALPASKYRATFTGLSYTEILDLSYSQELNNLDGEKKKWSIAYEHTKNPSIGPFENFEDFLKKTSFIDLEFMLWKVLCATAMDKEIISIDCHGKLPSGAPCGRSYEWIYSPKSLLDVDKINVAVLDEMKKTAEAGSSEDIQNNYKESMLLINNTVELPSSKFRVIFGHISAYEYLNSVYPEIIKLRDAENPIVSQALTYSTLYVIKSFLIPKEDKSGYIRVKGLHNLVRIINNLNEIDWQTTSELVKIMIEPYQFTYVLKDIVCPQCKTKSNIGIDRMDRMLFIVAQSLSNVNVILKRN